MEPKPIVEFPHILGILQMNSYDKQIYFLATTIIFSLSTLDSNRKGHNYSKWCRAGNKRAKITERFYVGILTAKIFFCSPDRKNEIKPKSFEGD